MSARGRRPSALLLDLDGTLVARDAAFGAWLAHLGLDPSVEARLVACDRGGHGPRAAFFAALGVALGIGPARARARFHHELPEHVGPRPDVASWLDRFDGPKVVVTNGTARLQRAKLDAAGLARHVDAVITSAEHGAPKPHPSIFRAALALAGIAATDAAMIGDHPVHDLAGARQAGIDAVLIRSPWFDVPPGEIAVASPCEVTW